MASKTWYLHLFKFLSLGRKRLDDSPSFLDLTVNSLIKAVSRMLTREV